MAGSVAMGLLTSSCSPPAAPRGPAGVVTEEVGPQRAARPSMHHAWHSDVRRAAGNNQGTCNAAACFSLRDQEGESHTDQELAPSIPRPPVLPLPLCTIFPACPAAPAGQAGFQFSYQETHLVHTC